MPPADPEPGPGPGPVNNKDLVWVWHPNYAGARDRLAARPRPSYTVVEKWQTWY